MQRSCGAHSQLIDLQHNSYTHGLVNKTATVYTNGKPGKVVLQIKGRVAPKNKK